MNNEPVAWWDGNPKNAIGISKTKDCDDWQPLYTHPVKEQSKIFNEKGQELILGGDGTRLYKNPPVKELTDEEILAVWDEDCVVLDEDKLVIRFARAILRKAQQK